MFFSAGIGITPFSSILQSLWKKHNDSTSLKKHKKIDFIWVNREYESFEWFMNLLAVLTMQQSLTTEKFIDIHLYWTDKNCENSTAMKKFSNIISSMPDTNLRLTIEEMFKGIHRSRPNFSNVIFLI
jgi:NADPH oxidase